MTEYLVVRCPHCGKASAMKSTARTHMCPYCGRVSRLEEYTIIARVKSGKEARILIQQLNTPETLRARLSSERT